MPHLRLRARYMVPVFLAVLATWIWNIPTPIDEPDLPAEMFVVAGTVESFRTTSASTGSGNRRIAAPVYLVTLREHPRVEFSVRNLPSKELVPGTPVRFEMGSDPGPTLESGRLFENALYRIRADTFVADGIVLYTAAEVRAAREARSDTALMRYRSVSLLMWAVVVIWIALLVRRHRVLLRSLLHPDGASTMADRLRRWVYRE
ncbi:hypothetical protein ABZS52_27255 [Micromonospora profundi]|uniref:hypothetical protein n=1 Tax=Micromonospora profundi TaxID=1420889 RepID=UPI00339DABFF